ncbi:MAG: hypothetical protein EXR72_25505 [Myxococcales bacterium]|nr:hypothetical protein [Myxococcales bacterium]
MPSLRTGRLRLRLRLRDEQEPARGPPPLLSTRVCRAFAVHGINRRCAVTDWRGPPSSPSFAPRAAAGRRRRTTSALRST